MPLCNHAVRLFPAREWTKAGVQVSFFFGLVILFLLSRQIRLHGPPFERNALPGDASHDFHGKVDRADDFLEARV